MGDSVIQPGVQTPFVNTPATDGGAAEVYKAGDTRQKIAALAKQFNVTQGVARSLYRGILKKDPDAAGASLLAQFAQAVSKRTLAQVGKPQNKSANGAAAAGTNATGNVDVLTKSAPVNQFLTAATTANTSGLSSQEYKQVTQNPQAGPVLPPPKKQPGQEAAQALAQVLTHSPVPHLDPNNPNWQAFYAFLMDAWSDHAQNRMIESQAEESALRQVEIDSAMTGVMLTEMDIFKERRQATLDAFNGVMGAHSSLRAEAAKDLVSANPNENTDDLGFTDAFEKQAYKGAARDLSRSDAVGVLAGARKPGEQGHFMDADAKDAEAVRTGGTRPGQIEKDIRHHMTPYRAQTDAQSVARRQSAEAFVNDLRENRSLDHVDLDKMILTQAIPGEVVEADPLSTKVPTHVDRRFLTKAEISALSPKEQRQWQDMFEGFHTARMDDVTDRVQAMQQEVGRLRSAAQMARNEAHEGKECPDGTDMAVYKQNCAKMAEAFDKKARDLTSEQLDGQVLAKHFLQSIAFTNRFSMRSIMQRASWLDDLATDLRTKISGTHLSAADEGSEEHLAAKQRLQVLEETAYALNRRTYDLYKSIKPYRGDATQPKDKPLQRNERLDQMKTAPGATDYNETWDAYEKLQAKTGRSDEELEEMAALRTDLAEMRDAAPANVWEPWRLERLKVKLDKLKADPSAKPDAIAGAQKALDHGIVEAQNRVDSKWLAAIMDRHMKGRQKILLAEAKSKIVKETDPAKKASLVQDEADLKARLETQKGFWKTKFDRSKLNTVMQKAQTVATAVGLGPSISYKIGTPSSKPVPHKGRQANIAGNEAVKQKADAILKQRRDNNGAAPSAQEADAIRADLESTRHAAYKQAQEKYTKQDAAIVHDADDKWLDGSAGFKHEDPGVDYKDPRLLDKRLTRSIKSMGATLKNWDDSNMDSGSKMFEAAAGMGDSFASNLAPMGSVAENMAQESADTAGNLVSQASGDFASAYDQIMAMRRVLLPLVAKANPWG